MRIPKHIGIIPDGNRRWASQAGLEKKDGYAHGLAPGLELLRLAAAAGVEEIDVLWVYHRQLRPPPGAGTGFFGCLRRGGEAHRRRTGLPAGGGGQRARRRSPGSCGPIPPDGWR